MVAIAAEHSRARGENPHFFGKADFILCVTVLIAALLALLLSGRYNTAGEPLRAEVTVDGEPYAVYKLSDYSGTAQSIVIDTSPRTRLVLEDETIRFADSLCPDRTCEKCGRLKSRGDTAVCLPARVCVKITGGTAGNDAVAY